MNNYPSYFITITPAQADAYLKQNKHNRPIDNNRVERYAEAMKKGDWVANGESIVIGDDGNILNGQHRLTACVRSNTPFTTLIVINIPVAAFSTYDQTKTRNSSDVFAISGEINTSMLSAACKKVYHYENDNLTSIKSVPIIEIERTLAKHPNIRDSVAFITQNRSACLMAPSIAAACHYLFNRKDPKLNEAFFEKFISGLNISSKEPVYLLRERIIKNNSSTSKLPTHHVFALTIKAWNATRQNRHIKTLRWSTEEGFPNIT